MTEYSDLICGDDYTGCEYQMKSTGLYTLNVQ